MKRAFAEHTWKEIEALPKDPGVVVLPIGAIEQHGPHLPLLTDALLAEETVRAAFARLPEGVPAWYLPVLCYPGICQCSAMAKATSTPATPARLPSPLQR